MKKIWVTMVIGILLWAGFTTVFSQPVSAEYNESNCIIQSEMNSDCGDNSTQTSKTEIKAEEKNQADNNASTENNTNINITEGSKSYEPNSTQTSKTEETTIGDNSTSYVNNTYINITGENSPHEPNSTSISDGDNNPLQGGLYTVDSDTIAYWKFDKTDDADEDFTDNNHDLTSISGASQVGNTPYGRCLFFDGNDDQCYRTPSDTSEMTTTNYLTVSANFFSFGENKINPSTHQMIVSRYYWSTGQRFWSLYIQSNGILRFVVRSASDGGTSILSSEAIQYNEWYQVTAIYDSTATKKMKLYINGELDASTTSSVTLNGNDRSTPIRIGDNPYAGSGDNPFYGYIDEVNVHKSVTNEGGLIGFWNLNEGTGTTARDRSPLEDSDGTISGSPSWSTGMFEGRCIQFDGTNDYVNIPSDLGDPYEMTIEFWFYVSAGDKTRTQYLMDGRNGGNWWFLQSYNPSGAGNLNFYNKVKVNPSDWTAGKWNHLILTTDSTASKIYINGELKATGSGLDPDIGTNMRIGTRYTNSYYFRGKMDEIRIYDTKEDVSVMGCDVATYPFEGLSAWLYDQSPWDNDLTAYNAVRSDDNGNYGDTASFDGYYDYLKKSNLDSGLKIDKCLTVEAWINPDTIQLCEIVDAEYAYTLRLRSDGKIQFYFHYYDGGMKTKSVISNSIVTANGGWYHVAGSYDGHYLRVFINGECEGVESSTETIYYYYDGDLGLYIGAKYWGDGRFFDGYIDEVRISNYARDFTGDTDGDGMPDIYEIVRSKNEDSEQYNPIEANKRVGVITVGEYFDQQDYTWFLSSSADFYYILKSFGYFDIDIYYNVHINGPLTEPDNFNSNYVDDSTPSEGELQNLLASFRSNGNYPLTTNDFLLFLWVDHGGNEKDQQGQPTWDVYVNFENGNTMRDDELDAYFNNIVFKRAALIFQQCYGGGFLDDLSGTNRATCSAVRFDEQEGGWIEKMNDVFQYGDSIDDGDYLISIYEAWARAAIHVYAEDQVHSQIEDNSDGTPHWYNDQGFDFTDPTKDGYLMYRTYL